jgi:hypothetical protein
MNWLALVHRLPNPSFPLFLYDFRGSAVWLAALMGAEGVCGSILSLST